VQSFGRKVRVATRLCASQPSVQQPASDAEAFCSAQKNAVAVSHCKRGKGLIKVNGTRATPLLPRWARVDGGRA
jgi:hypothetical protein